ncbi:MAG: hypothetical protein IJA34_06905 [Lachnospiraceae bacterium]|nr:hypothetical protein [Lachnospiraceae bacterium]
MKTVKRGYRFTDKNNSSGGIVSSILGAISLCLVVVGVVISYKENGNAGLAVGAIGSIAFILNCIGMIIGLRSFKERDKFYLFSWIGVIANGIMWIMMCVIIAGGLMM